MQHRANGLPATKPREAPNRKETHDAILEQAKKACAKTGYALIGKNHAVIDTRKFKAVEQ